MPTFYFDNGFDHCSTRQELQQPGQVLLININIKVYENDKYVGSIDLNFFFNTNLCDKEIELLKNEIKEYVNKYKQN